MANKTKGRKWAVDLSLWGGSIRVSSVSGGRVHVDSEDDGVPRLCVHDPKDEAESRILYPRVAEDGDDLLLTFVRKSGDVAVSAKAAV